MAHTIRCKKVQYAYAFVSITFVACGGSSASPVENTGSTGTLEQPLWLVGTPWPSSTIAVCWVDNSLVLDGFDYGTTTTRADFQGDPSATAG